MFEGFPLIGLTAPTLLGIAVLLLLLGRIVPRAILLDKQREADRWREAYNLEREARATLEAHTAELLEVSKTTHAVTVALFDVVRQSGEHNVSSKNPFSEFRRLTGPRRSPEEPDTSSDAGE